MEIDQDLKEFQSEIEQYEQEQQHQREFFKWLYVMPENEKWDFREVFGNRT